MSAENLLKTVIDRYEISLHMSPQARAAMNRSKRKNLAMILKKQVSGIIFINTTVAFFLWVKKYGISLSFAKSAVAVSVAILSAAGIVSYSAVFTAGMVLENMQKDQFSQPVIEQTVDVSVLPEQDAARRIVSYAVAVNRVEMKGGNSQTRSRFTDDVIRELRSLKGGNAAISSNSIDNYHVSDKVLSVSIITLAGSPGEKAVFRVSVKLINSADSRVLLYVAETAQSEDKIQDSIKALMKKVAAVL